ncbi:MAG: hypothetical protein GX456_16155 [Verrucomicrobia bacterium]|nr:hypothetical protein [Verrucomicrobiota bacterium]
MTAPNTFAHFLAGWLAFAATCAAQATAQSAYKLQDSIADTGQLKERGAVSEALLAAETDQSVPVVETIIPVPGRTLRELYSIEVQFAEPVIGVDAGDLLVNGVAATNMIQIAPSDFLFTFPQPGDGLVRIEWSANHGITDQAEPAHPFSGGSWTYALDSTLPSPSLFISEFMADNKDTINDEDGDSSDWIEIGNSDSEPASLAGWYLTDNPANPTKWAFPEVDVPARGFIVVFASGKNRADIAGKLHTNFKLASTGGYLALVDPRTNVVSDFAPVYPKQFTDVSYGRVPGEITTIGYFTRPTPGTQNTSGGPGFAPAVEFSRPSCTFTTPFELELRTSLPDAVIRYTLDGNLPTNSSPVYAGPLWITNSVQVRARAYQQGLLPGPPSSESYIILHTNVVAFSSDLPVIVLHTLGKGTPNASRLTFAHMSVFEPAGGQTSLTNSPTLTSRVGIQIRGSSTEGIAKSSYKLEVWDEFNADRKLGILGMPPESDWVLYAPNNFEPVLIHNPFVHQLSRDMGRYSPRTRFVEVYLNKSTGPITPTHYVGIYVLEEKIKIGPDRLDIGKLEPEITTPPAVTGGYLMKIDRLDPGDTGLSAGGANIAMVDPKEKEIKSPQRIAQKNYLVSYLNAFRTALYSTNWRDPVLGYKPYINVPGWIDYHVLEVLSGNVDALVLSAYFHKPRNGALNFGPHWDFDRALGSTDGRDANPRMWNTGPFFGATWWSRLFTDPDFWQAWVDRWQELRETHFALTNLHGLVDRLADEVRQAQPREYAKWRVVLRGGSYQSEVNLMKNWLSNRVDFIDRQLTQPPRLGSHGGRVEPGHMLTIAGPTGATIYYTMDGTDPRAPQGGVSANARVYSGPIAIDSNARVVARARDPNKRQTGGPPSSTPWSRPVAATFVVNLPQLLLTEIMFHPAPAPLGATNSSADFEFLELKNAGDTPIALPGFTITNGIQFTFTTNSDVTLLDPGDRVLLVKNRAAFQARYPGTGQIAGEFTGSLDNAGDRITLYGPLGELVWDIVYGDAWAPLADGFGFSLVLADESVAPEQVSEQSSWRLSAVVGGSPGMADPPPPCISKVRINEIRSHPITPDLDAIELVNPSHEPADVSGWYLTDDFREPFKYRIRPGTIIPPRSVIVIDESAFGVGSNGFALSAWGDEAFLFSADAAGNLTGYYHGMVFGASPQGTTFGWYRSSDGVEHCVRESQPSIGKFNYGPRIGPVVFSEIMFDPPDVGVPDKRYYEYIELFNASHDPVFLFDTNHPASTWIVRGAVEFEFPARIVMRPGECVLLVGFNPATDPDALAEFRRHYNVGQDVNVFGPWRGSLGASELPIRLFEPGNPVFSGTEGAGDVPYYLVEEVHFRLSSFWPGGNSVKGFSLGRRSPHVFGDDPASWVVSRPGPGIIDSDGDGLPDDWEIRYGLSPFRSSGNDGADGDPDGDGIPNKDEYRNGTEPWLGPAHLECRKSAALGQTVEVEFVSFPFRTTTLLGKPWREQSGWEPLIIIPPLPNRATNLYSEPASETGRLYMLQIE